MGDVLIKGFVLALEPVKAVPWEGLSIPRLSLEPKAVHMLNTFLSQMTILCIFESRVNYFELAPHFLFSFNLACATIVDLLEKTGVKLPNAGGLVPDLIVFTW